MMSLIDLAALLRQLGIPRGGLRLQHLDDAIDQTEHSQQHNPGNLDQTPKIYGQKELVENEQNRPGFFGFFFTGDVAGWWCNVPILKNDGVRQWEGLSHILWNIKNVPNHQPGTVDIQSLEYINYYQACFFF